MKQSNICGIYEIRNKVNNKIYIGSSSCIISRWASHRHMLNNNKHSNIHLQRSWNKHVRNSLIVTKVKHKLLNGLQKEVAKIQRDQN